MSNLHVNDQAASLRRIMATPAPRIVSILSAAANHDQSRMMTNLANSIALQDNKVLVISASKESSETYYGINALPTLVEIANNPEMMHKAIYASPHGFSIAKLMQKSQLNLTLKDSMHQKLHKMLDVFSHQFDILLVDTCTNPQEKLPLSSLNQGQILIQLTRDAESIKNAYALIKRLSQQLDRHSFGIIVGDASELQAQAIYHNIRSVAERYLQVDLEFFGAIPFDDHLQKATQLGRSVVEAFPLAIASSAFKKIAQRLDNRQQSIDHNKQAALV